MSTEAVSVPAVCSVCGNLYNPIFRQTPGKRVCGSCGKKIRRHDKWMFGNDGRPVHKDCKNPTGLPETELTGSIFG